MSNLQEYTSLYDKNSRLAAEPKPKDMNPQNGDFYTEEGVSNSPFNSEDHLVDLLQDKLVQSNNSGVTYNPAAMQGYYPGPPGGDQDFDGRDDGQGIFTSKTKYDGKKVLKSKTEPISYEGKYLSEYDDKEVTRIKSV